MFYIPLWNGYFKIRGTKEDPIPNVIKLELTYIRYIFYISIYYLLLILPILDIYITYISNIDKFQLNHISDRVLFSTPNPKVAIPQGNVNIVHSNFISHITLGCPQT